MVDIFLPIYSGFQLTSTGRTAPLSTVRPFSSSGRCLAGVDPRDETIYTEEHWEMRQALRKLIEGEINPYVDEWEAAKEFPAHQVSML